MGPGPPPLGGFPPMSAGHFLLCLFGFRIKMCVDVDVDVWSFWARSWVPLRSHARSFWRLCRPKLVPKLSSHRFIIEQVVAHETSRFLMVWGVYLPKIWPQNGPRSPQIGLKTVLTCDRFLHQFYDSFLVVFGLRFGVLLGPQGGPKIDPSSPRLAWRATATWFSKYEPRPRREHDFQPPGSPRWHQDRPKLVLRPF